VPERVLILASRFPWPPITGDRVRALAWLQALCPRAAVTLVAPPGQIPQGAPPCRFVPAPSSIPALLDAGVRTLVDRLPLTALLAAGRDWRGAIARAQQEGGPFSTAVVLLARLDPWVFRHLRADRVLFDAIDSLAANLAERASAAPRLLRRAWLWESRRTARLERAAGSRYDRVVVVAEAERAAFGDRAQAVFHGVELTGPGSGVREFDLGFWGRLAYFANRDAVGVLVREIWPQVRASLPNARLLVAGADAPRSIRALHGHGGISVVSPIGDRAALLRTVKVAVLPLRFGSGQSNKVLEGAEASCALVATPEAVRGLEAIAADAAIERTPAALADQAIDLLCDPARLAAAGQRLRQVVEREFSREAACERLAALVLGEEKTPPISG
jgi:glycosyltransferase involved in cell wall biosynthesis